jgi:hypothetical protein
MNRHQRRKAAKLGDVLEITWGRALIDGGTAPQCFACDGLAPAWPWPDGPHSPAYGFALINYERILPICEACFKTNGDAVVRRFWNAPDLKISEGGEASMETIRQIADALAVKDEATSH